MPREPSSPNRLSRETSPYLLLHQDNPVDWYAWSDEAIQQAKGDDKPIFLSVGYSTCYWCHVMERESFSDPQIAALMNESFINIKVDREERPDLDEIYMVATQLLSQHGGWPNSVFLTPDLNPFFAGTYFPPQDRPGMPGFPTVLRSLHDAWLERRADVEEQAQGVAEAIKRYQEESRDPNAPLPGRDLARRCLEDLARHFDDSWGGFGGAPKFPTPANLQLLLELADQDVKAAEMLATTLDSMARGGLYDQLAGGFHRYATDREWKIPHFEKMLYDNGILLEIYARQWERQPDPEVERIVRETVAFLGHEMTSSDGAFYSAIDAETDGREGAYYVWTRNELLEILGDEEFGFLAPLLGFDGKPFFEGSHYVLHLPRRLTEQAERRRLEVKDLLAQMRVGRERLLEARWQRPRPATDDKILADWNGMAITGLAEAGRLLGEVDWIERANRAAEFVLGTLWSDGTLHHSWRQGQVGSAAFLSDYVFLIRGLLALHRATAREMWLERSIELANEQEQRLADSVGGYFVAAESVDLIARSKDVADGALPGANAIAILNLLDLAAATSDSRWSEAAEASLQVFGNVARDHPAAARTLAIAAGRVAAADSDGHPSHGDEPATATSSVNEATDQAVRGRLKVEEPDSDGWQDFGLELEIAAGWHLYAPGAEVEGLSPVRLEGKGVELTRIEFPPPVDMELAPGDRLPVYLGALTITGRIRAVAATDRALLLRFQACDENRCLAVSEIEMRLEPRE